MDNLTHSLIGLAAAKAGLDRLSPYATPLCVVAANAPDADIITVFAGPSVYIHEHRGVSHSIVGTLIISLIVALLFYGVAWLLARWRKQPNPANLRGLTLAALIVGASHPLLDWTNNYGLRPLLPWSGRWYYGDLVFIVDPWLWLSLGGVCFLLATKKWHVAAWAVLWLIVTAAVFALPILADLDYPLASRVLWFAGSLGLACARYFDWGRRFGPALPAAALVAVVAYWGALSLLHSRALNAARREFAAADFVRAPENALRSPDGSEPRYAAMPTLANPLRWQGIADTWEATYRFELNLARGDRKLEKETVERFVKLSGEEARIAEAAKRDEAAAAFLGFSRFPAAAVGRNCAAETIVRFADLRFTEPNGSGRNGNFRVDVNVGK